MGKLGSSGGRASTGRLVLRRRWARYTGIGAAALLTLSLAATACGGGSNKSSSQSGGNGSSKDPYYIGAELSLSGDYAVFDKPMLQGLRLAVKKINKRGGVLGHPVKLAYENDDSDVSKVDLAMQKLLSGHKKFIYMLPNVVPPITDVVLKYTEKEGIASFDSGSGPGLFDVNKHAYNFSIFPANELQVPAFVAAFRKLAGSSAAIKLGVLNDSDPADKLVSKEVIAGTRAVGGKIADHEKVDTGATDVSVAVSKLKSSGANVLIVQTSGSTPLSVAKAIDQLGWHSVKLVVTPAAVSSQVMTAVPKTVRPQYFTLGEAIYRGTGHGPQPKYEDFAQRLSQTPEGVVDLELSANIGDSASLAAWAVDKAGATKIDKVLNVLEHLGKNPPPKNVMLWTPNPRWTATNHTFSNAKLGKDYWALLKPGKPVKGTYPGDSLTIPDSLQMKVDRAVSKSS